VTRLAALVFAVLIGAVMLFQLALALGAPWGDLAMGGAFPGAYPPIMRLAALGQILLLAVLALIVLARAEVVRTPWRAQASWLIWAVVALSAVATALNLITPSGGERVVWAPVAVVLLLSSLRVALGR
jgi:hypothetical protein